MERIFPNDWLERLISPANYKETAAAQSDSVERAVSYALQWSNEVVESAARRHGLA
ncbi:hypothetical protein [Cohnella endophytica]|uniref:hypothetical protein n=1 Tax=Cohnella endophytica TaxID=2419778 RepID=UPI001314C13A|nr:hypothetical protein [Cohnella endophytica]